MSEFTTAWTCPECGIDVTSGRHYQLDCLAHQLAQRDERNAALEARALRMERALRTIEAWPFNIMGDCVADARALARKALEE